MAEIYSTEEVEEHNTEEDGSFFFWLTSCISVKTNLHFQNKTYDNFVNDHHRYHAFKTAFVILNESVYDISEYLESNQHPGGNILINEYLGKDISAVFQDNDIHNHSPEAYRLLELFLCGKLKH